MAKSKKIEAASDLLSSGSIKSLQQLIALLPTTTFSRQAGTSPERLGRMVIDPFKFEYRDVFNMAKVLECDPKALNELIFKECLAKQHKKKK